MKVFVSRVSENANIPDMRCRKCFQERVLVRGICMECAPELHQQFKKHLDFISRMGDEFQRKTGKRSLEDWEGFEQWLVQYHAQEFVNVFVLHLLPPK